MMKFRLSSFRRLVQGVTFAIFIALFAFTTYPFPLKFPLDAYLRLDPLIATVAMVASRMVIVTMLWAIILVVLSLIIGRFFCGFMCPLGTLIDFSDYVIFGKRISKETHDPKPYRRIKYFILIAVIAAALVGANFAGFFSPLSIAPRVFTLVIFPPVLWLLNSIIDLLRPVLVGMGWDTFTQFNLGRVFFLQTIPALLLFTGIIAANYWRKRFWCRYICPTGALLSLFSRFGLVKRTITGDTCVDCGICISKCKMAAIEADPRKTVLSECILCGDCIDVCKRKANTISLTKFGFSGQNGELDVQRRTLLLSATSGLVLASLVKSELTGNKTTNGRFIRPPGSIPEMDFVARCVRCGECMKVCKTNAIQPASLEAGFDSLWTPRLVLRHGACDNHCNICGHVCPTQAIRKLPIEEKSFVKIGTAVVDRTRCIAWQQEKLCLICDEICPVNAIETRIVDNFRGPFKRPFVNDEKCIGCGYCEKACPVSGRGAIEVYSSGEERKKSGSYITERKKQLRELQEGSENQYNANQLGSGGEAGGAAQITPPAPQSKNGSDAQSELPKGFSE